MPISWNEIRQRAIRFSKEWEDAASERGQAQTFWNEFFDVFGISRRAVASFEEPVRTLKDTYGFIDLFWKGQLLVEHKSLGADLDKASSQAFDYIQDLISDGRHDEIPRYVIVSDFAKIALYDLEPEEQKELPLFAGRRVETVEFHLAHFHQNIHHFAFIPGYKQHKYQDQDPINLKAVSLMGDLHDALEAGGYTGHELERLLVRILFCLFAEDTGIFERDAFTLWLKNNTKEDGSDFGARLAELFDVLNTPTDKRQKNLDESLAAFPYVNGELYAERLGFAAFNSDMRNALLASTRFDWSRISPAVFGALFQCVMQPKERRQIGAHYTSERDILKVIHPLFLDDLKSEFDRVKNNSSRLQAFHKKIANLHFLDPACGCGNFLVITYRELRKLELEVLKTLYGGQKEFSFEEEINRLAQVDVDQFYGIEIEEWPARIAEVALWLMDHQMNLELSNAFGQLYQRLPLKKSPQITIGNALRLDWKQILSPEKCSYILGNPPFVGAKYQTNEQRADMKMLVGDVKNFGLLDYVTAWYFKAGDYIQDTQISVGFVSTNSITQGEQVGVLWLALFQQGIKIHFGYRTFPWESEARGKAHVHVVIIGFGAFDRTGKRIFECEITKVNGQKNERIIPIDAANISPYLIEGSDIVLMRRSNPICSVLKMISGNKPIDDGNYLFTPQEKDDFLQKEPKAKKYFHRWIGSQEFINGIERWCLWLGECSPEKLREMSHCLERVKSVQRFRSASKSQPTQKLASFPTRFHTEFFPQKTFLIIPQVSSERRHYIPMTFGDPALLCGDKLRILPEAQLWHFGILVSTMHMAWVRQVTGRLKSDYQYSAKIVYNNFPWPQKLDSKRVKTVEAAAQKVLDVRQKFQDGGGSTLADLYDPLAMPPELHKAHAALDKAVDLCYRPQPFTNERQRVEFLFALYEQLSSPLLPATKPNRRRVRRKIKGT